MRRIVAALVLAAVVLNAACNLNPAVPLEPDDEALLTDLAARGPVDPMSKVNRLPPELERRVGALRADLEAQGYEVARGYWTLWTAEDCKYPLRTVGFCYGNNPTAPYVIAVVPRWSDEFRDRHLQQVILQAQRNMSVTFRLDEQEALVVLAEMPPPARYFGSATNIFTRETTVNAEDPIYAYLEELPLLQNILFATSPNPSRMMLFSSVGNTTNNVVMERQSESPPWGQQRYFVISPDAGMAAAMTDALVRAGVPADHVFTEPVSPDLVNVGLGPEADDFITYIRYALPEPGYEVAGEQWRERLPLTILRVRTTSGEPKPFPIPAYHEKTANFDEREHLKGDLEALIAAVRVRWDQPDASLGLSFSAHAFLDLVGQHCLGVGSHLENRGPMNCLGDTPDTDYQINLPMVLLDKVEGQEADPVIAAVGTLATATGNATYVSLGVNSFPELVAVANLSDEDLDGTATRAGFGEVLGENAEKFYVYYLARDCTGLDPCLEIPTTLVAVGDQIKLMQRNYINPGSLSGPDPAKLLNPVVIILDGSGRP
jgi:hypothetical protein